ncbi:MAG: GNAT family N-acetyltransferase [Candidatus Latescibacterota bacterium]
MAGKLETARIEDRGLWNEFVTASPQGSVFSTTAWLESAAGAQGGVPAFLGVFGDGQLLAGAAFIEVKRGPVRKASAPVLAPYCGFLYAPFSGTKPSEEQSRNSACAAALIDYLLPRYGHVFLVQDPRVTDVREFLWRGFSCPVRYTYLLDITDPDRLWEGMERRVRTVIRNAGTSLAPGGALEIREFGRLYERTYRDRGNPPPIPRALVENLVERLIREGVAEMRSVRDEQGAPVASMVFAFDRRSVYALVSGTIPSRNPSGASSLLFWDAVKRHAGLRGQLDLVGANIRSIAFFKKGFGGTLTPYYATERYASPVIRAALNLFTRMHKAFS